MPAPSPPACAHTRLALIGFTPFERRTMQEFFELHRVQGPGYETTDDLTLAECAVADADDASAMACLRGSGTLLERAVLLGRTRQRDAALQLPRPINLMLVMRALDTLVGARPRPGEHGTAAADDAQAPPPPARRVAPHLVALPETMDTAAPTPASAPTPTSIPPGRTARDNREEGGEFKAVTGTSGATPPPQPRPAATAPPGARVVPPAVPATRRPGSTGAAASAGSAASTPPAASAPAAAEPAAPPPGKHVQRVLDELAFRTATLPPDIDVQAFESAATARSLPAATAAGSARTAGATVPAAPATSASARNRPASASAAGAAHGREPARHGRHAPLPMEHVLVIDQDAATLQLVAVQLQRFGFQIHLAGHPDDALRQLTRRFHDYVFMDPALPGLDALLACRLARRMPPPEDRSAATVVLLADPAAASAPLARALPAADGCLKKPLGQRALLKLVGEREVTRVPYADTARTTTVI